MRQGKALKELSKVRGLRLDGPVIAIDSVKGAEPFQHHLVAFTRSQVVVTGLEKNGRTVRTLQLHRARATVDTSGNVAIAQGWVVKERRDARQMFLTIESDKTVVLALRPEQEAQARRVAAAINEKATAAGRGWWAA